MSSEFENVTSFVFSMNSVLYIDFTATTSTKGMGLPLHANTMLIIPDVHCEMTCFILSAPSSLLTSSRHECWVCDGCEVKQPLHSRFIFEDINNGKIVMMTPLDFSNESVKLGLSLSAISTLTLETSLRASYISRILNKEEEVMCWAIIKKIKKYYRLKVF